MRTAKEILYEKAAKYKDGFMTGQFKWLLEAMEEYRSEERQANDALYSLLRETVMRNQLAFPESEQDIKWFEEGLKGMDEKRKHVFMNCLFSELKLGRLAGIENPNKR